MVRDPREVILISWALFQQADRRAFAGDHRWHAKKLKTPYGAEPSSRAKWWLASSRTFFSCFDGPTRKRQKRGRSICSCGKLKRPSTPWFEIHLPPSRLSSPSLPALNGQRHYKATTVNGFQGSTVWRVRSFLSLCFGVYRCASPPRPCATAAIRSFLVCLIVLICFGYKFANKLLLRSKVIRSVRDNTHI